MDYPTQRVATYDDLFSVPDNMVGEIIAGELITQPRPGPKHAQAASVVGAILLNKYHLTPTDDPHGCWIIDEPECHLGADIVVPDIAGWKKSTMPKLPETAWFGTRPDWVCEVISPATAKYYRGTKRDVYAREGIGHFWIVDPVERMIEVFNLDSGKWVLAMTVSDDQVAQMPPFVELPFDLSLLWA